jgi:hypothetical protein
VPLIRNKSYLKATPKAERQNDTMETVEVLHHIDDLVNLSHVSPPSLTALRVNTSFGSAVLQPPEIAPDPRSVNKKKRQLLSEEALFQARTKNRYGWLSTQVFHGTIPCVEAQTSINY